MTRNGAEDEGVGQGTGRPATGRPAAFDTDPRVPIARRLEAYAEGLEAEGSTERARVIRGALREYRERTEAGDPVGALLALHSIGTKSGSDGDP